MEREGCYIKFAQAGTRLVRGWKSVPERRDYVSNYAPAGYAFADILPFPDNQKS